MIVWQAHKPGSDQAENLAKISQWWSNLDSKEISWQQRVIPQNGQVREIDWQQMLKFDEKFIIKNPQLRGITLYWYKPDLELERNTTVDKLELDPVEQRLWLYPRTQSQLVICVTRLGVNYQTIELVDPLIAGTAAEDKCLLLLRDVGQKLQIKLILNRDSLVQLRENLPD